MTRVVKNKLEGFPAEGTACANGLEGKRVCMYFRAYELSAGQEMTLESLWSEPQPNNSKCC